MPANEVQPPHELLTLDWWDHDVPAPAASSVPDHETIMELSRDSPGSEKSIRTTRRLGPWQFLDETVNGVRREFEITHDSQRMHFKYIGERSGTTQWLTVTRPSSLPVDSSLLSSAAQRKGVNRSETVLGETCSWFDMMPGVADGSRWACLTHDGIILKDEISSWGSHLRTWTAVSFARRPVSLDEIKPPAELVDPKTWGID